MPIEYFDNGFKCQTIESNSCLDREIKYYWKHRYISPKNNFPDESDDFKFSKAVYILKNQDRKKTDRYLDPYAEEVKNEISEGLDFLIQHLEAEGQPWVVVAVPRSKANFLPRQLRLIKAISDAVPQQLENGAYFIKRHTNTATTHLKNIGNWNSSSEPEPYKGITRDTCRLEGDVRGKNVILIDDIYTSGVNVDEDCIQFLFDNGAVNVVLYTLCKT